MTAVRRDITIEQGSTFPESYLFEDITGNPLNLTGCMAAMQVRNSAQDPTALVSLTTANGGLTIEPLNGLVTPNFDSSPLNPGQYVYDLKLYDSGDNPIRLMQGSIYVIAEVTTL